MRGLIGVVHLPAMPGDPRCPAERDFAAVEHLAMADALALIQGGVDAVVVENFGSVPFQKGTAGHRLPPHQVAAMALVATRCARELAVPVGVNCLRSDARAALGIAAAGGLAFIRVNVHTGAYLTDQGVIEGEADQTLRYRQSLGAQHIQILADVLVKHAVPLAPLNTGDATRDCLERGMADGVIVTGQSTGAPVDRALLEEVRAHAEERPVLVGSGLSPRRADELAPLADGAIVGSWVKRGGVVGQPVDEARVRDLVAAVRGRFRTPGGA
jgi:hypothetical protein